MDQNLREQTRPEVEEIVNRETRAWDTKNLDLLMSLFHPDMVWVWPTSAKAHDPMEWSSFLGKFDLARWSQVYTEWFETFELVRNDRKIQKVFVTKECDGAFAVVDIDTLWKAKNGEESHWKGRTCKTAPLRQWPTLPSV